MLSHDLTSRTVDFGGLQIAYDDSVLAPRAWTRLQSLWAAQLAEAAPDGPILELCAGAGQIGLLAAARSGRDLVAIDQDETASGFARRNAAAAGLQDRVEVRTCSLAQACRPAERFPVIIADPPWVPAGQTSRFPEDPLFAIDGGVDGLEVARACVAVIREHLHPAGAALLQLGSTDQVHQLQPELAPVLGVAAIREEEGRGVVALIVRGA